MDDYANIPTFKVILLYMKKQTVWFEVGEKETIAECMERMAQQGFQIAGRKEEPLFEEVDGQPVPVKQIIMLKGIKETIK